MNQGVDVSGREVFSTEALFQDESVSGHDGAHFLDGAGKKNLYSVRRRHFHNKNPLTGNPEETFMEKNKTHEDQMAAVDSTVKVFFPLEVKGGVRKLREMRAISSPSLLQSASLPC